MTITVALSRKYWRIQVNSFMAQQGDLSANVYEPLLGKNLFPEQRCTLRSLLNQYSEVIQDNQVRQHFIITTDTQPVRLPPYRLLYAYRDAAKAEINDMLKYGVNDESHSD